MAKLNIEELVSGLLEAALVAQNIGERQHINSLRNYFDDKGIPKTTTVVVGEKKIEVPLYILADHSSIGLDKLNIEFEARILFGDDESKVSRLKKSLLGIFKKPEYENNIKEIHIDNGASLSKSGTAKISVHFKKDEKPEMVSRLVDSFIQQIGDPSVEKQENN
tara:strand:+ start:467 stop:958 length:492 start_codon:yes stop_codon:yes gene_type:complete